MTTIRTGGEEVRYWPGKPVPPLLLTQHPPIYSGVSLPIFCRDENSMLPLPFYAIYNISLIPCILPVFLLTGISYGSNPLIYPEDAVPRLNYTYISHMCFKCDVIRNKITELEKKPMER